MAPVTTSDGSPLLLDLIPSSRMKNLRDFDKWSSLRLCLSVREMSVSRGLGLYVLFQDG